MKTDHNIATLLDFHFRHEFKGSRGRHGSGNRKTGKRGDVSVIRVPVGTVVRLASTNRVLGDLTEVGQEVVAAKGGCGGLGNASAAEARPGALGQKQQLILELKLIAEVGIVGFPNAGKSSLLARISTARPKVGDYPFTTRYPVLGVVQLHGLRSFVACDIPGLIEGAHEGRGLGAQFLRHIERTRLLLHVVDMAGVDGRNPCEAYARLNEELTAYNPTLQQRPQLIVANKMDLPEAQAHVQAFRAAVNQPILPLSCATGEGVSKMLERVWARLHEDE